MIHEVEAGATKAKHAFEDATETVADAAKDQSDRVWRFARGAMKALPLTSARMVDLMLDRMGLMRRNSGFVGGAALFIGGFVAGSLTTALTTPVTGASLRKRVARTVRSLTEDAEETLQHATDSAVDAGKKVADGAKSTADRAADAGKHAIDSAKAMASDKAADTHLGNGRRAG